MSAIVLDASKVNSYVLPSLNKSENLMQTSYSTSVSLKNSLPSSFNYRSTVNEIVNQIYNIKKEINDIEGIIDSKLALAKRIESKSESRVSSIASAASKIGSVVGAVGGAALGTATSGVVGTAAGAIVGSSVGSTVGKALVNTGAKIVDGATKAAKSIWNGIKNIGTTIWNGCKKVAKAVTSFIKKAVSGLVKAAKAIWEALKWTGKQILRVGATIVNVVVSLVEGLVSFVEAIVDAVVVIVGGLVGSIGGMIVDLWQGIFNGEWDWSATGAVWKKGLLPFVATNWTDKLIFRHYSGTAVDNLAYNWAKRDDGIVYEVGKAVGYYAGIIIASAFTAGAAAGASAASTAAVQTTTAVMTGVGSMGKNSQKQFSTVIKNAETENREIGGGEIWKAVGVSAGKAVIDGGTLYLSGGVASKATDALKATNVGGKVINVIGDKGISIAIKATKGYTSEGFNSLVTGEKYDFDGATIDAVGTVLAETAALKFTKSGFYKNTISFKGKPQQSLQIKETIKIGEVANSEFAQELTDCATDTVVDSAKEQTKYIVGDLIKNSAKYAVNKAEEKTIKEIVGEVKDGLKESLV